MQTVQATSTTKAENIFNAAGRIHTERSISSFFNVAPTNLAAAATTDTPSSGDLNSLLDNAGKAPGATSVVTVPQAPANGDFQLIQNVQTLDSYIAMIAALEMYNNHPKPYDLSDPKQAAQFVIDLANARNFVLSGGTIKAIPMYLPMGEASTQHISKSTTSADLHLDLLTAMFGGLSLPANVLTELDAILTQVNGTLQSLKLSFETQSQTLNHFVSFYHLTPVPGTNPVINQMDVDFIYLQLAQSSWKASVGKSSVEHFSLDVSLTHTKSTMNSGIVQANTSSIVSAMMNLTGNDDKTIAAMTKLQGVKS